MQQRKDMHLKGSRETIAEQLLIALRKTNTALFQHQTFLLRK